MLIFQYVYEKIDTIFIEIQISFSAKLVGW